MPGGWITKDTVALAAFPFIAHPFAGMDLPIKFVSCNLLATTHQVSLFRGKCAGPLFDWGS